MSNGKEIFLSLCKDAIDQHNAGIDRKTLKQNIAFIAEECGIPMLSALTIVEHMDATLNSLTKSKSEINMTNFSKTFLEIASAKK